MNKYLSACGLDCPSCECYQATMANDVAAKADIAVRWSKNYNATLTAEDINCTGCLSDGERFNWCQRCPIRACVQSKGHDSCADCADFPCATNEFLYNAVPTVKENIATLRSEKH